ncbi:MAG: hypothetical protein ACJAUM_001304 [Pseudomonadales bacterium]|jgi:hypothetical protein
MRVGVGDMHYISTFTLSFRASQWEQRMRFKLKLQLVLKLEKYVIPVRVYQFDN